MDLISLNKESAKHVDGLRPTCFNLHRGDFSILSDDKAILLKEHKTNQDKEGILGEQQGSCVCVCSLRHLDNEA